MLLVAACEDIELQYREELYRFVIYPKHLFSLHLYPTDGRARARVKLGGDRMTDETESGYAEGWKPSAGDRVQGVVTDVTATDGGYGVYPVVTLKREDGTEVAVHAFHTVLRKELARRRPGVGDDLDITYLGKKKGGRGDIGYDAYRVKSSKDPKFNWDSELSDEERGAWASGEPPIESSPVPQPADPAVQPAPAGDFGDVPF